jgi:ribosome-binding protein aMBF1 (putative translation factor)
MAADSKAIAIPTSTATAPAPVHAVTPEMEVHAIATRKTQATARAAKRPTVAKAGETAAAKSKPASDGSPAPRKVTAKADPADVAKYFASTGLSRKELAAAIGVSTSLIGTVAKETGDRWSAERFAKARVQIDAAVKAAASRPK